MGRFFGNEIKTDLVKHSQLEVKLPLGSFVKLGGQGYALEADLFADLNASGAGGIDVGVKAADTFYNVFVIRDGSDSKLVMSVSDIPTGFSLYSHVGSFRTDAVPEIIEASSKNVGSLGDVKHSRLTIDQFISENGAGWMLYDGSSIAGSKLDILATIPTLEDVRGRFLRAKDYSAANNEDGDLALGAFQDDAFQAHEHQSQTRSVGTGAGAGTPYPDANPEATNAILQKGGYTNVPKYAEETRPRNITVNVFIKVN